MSVRPDGNRRLYRARREGLSEMWQFIDEMWSDRLARLNDAAELAERQTPSDPKTKRSTR